MTARHRGAGPLGHGDHPALPATVVFIPPLAADPPAWPWTADTDHPDTRLGCTTRPGPGEVLDVTGPDDPDPDALVGDVPDDGQACGMPRAVSTAVLALLAAGSITAAVIAVIGSR